MIDFNIWYVVRDKCVEYGVDFVFIKGEEEVDFVKN